MENDLVEQIVATLEGDIPPVMFEDVYKRQEVAGNLAFIGSIKDDVLDIEALATSLLGEMQRMLSLIHI